MKVRHVGITVTDLSESINFYVHHLGFKMAVEMDEAGEHIDRFSGLNNIDVRTVKLRGDDNCMIELLYYRSHPCVASENKKRNITAIGCSHFALTVPDLDYLYEHLRAQGVDFMCAPQSSPDGKVKLTFCRDPDGTLIELVQEL
tara:strand:+ start:1266 stop:1697 length:432 start_codon:yes stop_codon:yes gene_type:complete